MWSRSSEGSKVWKVHLLHLNLISWFDTRLPALVGCFVPGKSPWTFWTWSLMSMGRSEVKGHLLHLKFPRSTPIALALFLFAGLYLRNLVPPRMTVVAWQAACLCDANCFWLKVENPQSSQRIGFPSLKTECLLFFWNNPWALLMCSRKDVFQVEL